MMTIPMLWVLAACSPQAREDAPVQQAAAPADVPPVAKAQAAPADAEPVLPTPSEWTLAGGDRAELKTAPAAQITLVIAGGQVSGYGGCNQYNTSVTIEGAKVTFGPIAATKRGCPGDAGAAERAYFDALGAANAARVDGNTLVLQLADGGTLTFARTDATP